MKNKEVEQSRYEIRFSGSGGQGLITAAVIFAQAVGVYEGKFVCQTQSYGPEARGGKSKAEVVISDQPIDYPKALGLDMLLAMNQAACDAYFFDLKSSGLLVVDSTLVEQHPTSRIVALPFTEIARDELGHEMVANIIALGAIAVLSNRVSVDNMEKAVLARVPAGTETLNREALWRGIKEARSINVANLPRELMSEEEEV